MKINKHKLILQTLLAISLVGSSLMTNQISQFVGSINFNSTDGSEWTFMFYLCGDNDLEKHAIEIINELEKGYDLSKNISILALIDRIPGYDISNENFTGCRLYQIIPNQEESKIKSNLLQDYGERDMGNGYNLRMLIRYGFENFTAEHYFLSLYNHGGGLYGICYDDTSSNENTTSNLKISEIKDAINSASFFNDEHIDIVNLAGCLMGEVEVAYELRECADFLIFSQNFGRGGFTDWNTFLENINEDWSLTPYNLVEQFMDAYSKSHYGAFDKTTCSVIDLKKLDKLFIHIDNFSNNLTLTLFDNKHVEILQAREKSSNFKHKYVDIIDFCRKLLRIKDYMSEYPELELSIKLLIEKTREAILFNYQNIAYGGSANGLSVYFLYPYSINRGYSSYFRFGSAYDLDFIDESNWVGFIHFLYSNDIDDDRLPDWFELKYGLNYLSNDTDNNGIYDEDEDFDSDQLDNHDEYFWGASPYKIDSDRDGFSDYQETRENKIHTYPFTWDSDLDGFSDKIEINIMKTDPLDINDPIGKEEAKWWFLIRLPKLSIYIFTFFITRSVHRRKNKLNKFLRYPEKEEFSGEIQLFLNQKK